MYNLAFDERKYVMKIVRFKGGLGNQMFQYAFLRLLQIKYELDDVKADFSDYSKIKGDNIRIPRIFDMQITVDEAVQSELDRVRKFSYAGTPLSLQYKMKLLVEVIINTRYYFEWDRKYRDIDKIIRNSYFDGYWQSWKYLVDIENILRNEFCAKKEISQMSQIAIERYQNCNSVFIGVRRGDYLTNKKMIKHYGGIDFDYYKRAINYISARISNPTFIFFSNDIEWVKENMTRETLSIEKGAIEYREEQDIYSDFEELYVMSSCKNAIITNSTFNFWGAWLIDNPEKIVVAPGEWFKDGKKIDIVPEQWIKM